MILADKIIALRKKNGWSQEDLAEKLGVSRQSISKWEGAQSIPDMNKILKLSEVFSVSTDYLLKDEMGEDTAKAFTPVDKDSSEKEVTVSMEEASAFLSYQNRKALLSACATFLFIVSAAPLITIVTLAQYGKIPLSEDQAGGIGIVTVLVPVGLATALCLKNEFDGERFRYLKHEALNTAYGVDGMVKEKKARFQSTYSMQMILGVLICILSATPLFFSMIFFPDQDMFYSLSISILLPFVGIGAFLMTKVSVVWKGFRVLSEEDTYTRENKVTNKKNSGIGGAYWSVATLLYLAISFLFNAWDRSWVIWPIAGVGYAALITIVNLIRAMA